VPADTGLTQALVVAEQVGVINHCFG